MSDPITSGAAKVAAEMIQEAQQAQATQAVEQQQPQAQFNQVLDAQRVGQVGELRMGNIHHSDVLRAARQAQAPAVPAIGDQLNTRPQAAEGIQRLMSDVMRGQNKLEEIIHISLSGQSFSSQELLALQAGVYRFTQELELTSKVVEKATSSVKQTLNTQV